MIHQCAHVIHAPHLLRKQDHGWRSVFATFQSLHLDRDFVIAECFFDQISDRLTLRFALLVTDFRLLIAKTFVQFRIHSLEFELIIGCLKPGQKLTINNRFGENHFSSLAFPK